MGWEGGYFFWVEFRIAVSNMQNPPTNEPIFLVLTVLALPSVLVTQRSPLAIVFALLGDVHCGWIRRLRR